MWLSGVIPAPVEFRYVDGRRLGFATLGDALSLALTTTFNAVDTGLRSDATGLDVRCELVTVARVGHPEVAAAVGAAAAKLEKAGGFLPAQPGILLPSLLDLPGKPTVHHGLLIAPYLWGGQTPQYREDNRLTLVLQLVMLTDAEYAFGVEEGVGKLQDVVAEQDIDLLDWSREG
ncbi:hypothetical protein GWO53_05255 [Corynebacterium macginleyi]|uniref:suppressor of fused domain protein n=1 Tax=Corynebacterium macginleyi TaxID=38290 RepID=UPI000EFA1B62|nr:suppressor of fused domain protein [Corynebacterium macginleyi]MBK4137449.1 hypothetical protein [Corynebacterium macginleyi]MBK4139899.1 hypothetical protein [Corynebacterium macginleyi]MBK4145524.1 hypothetical protein [Corynebacterium macginleyi]MBK4151173.1 hypothetical protein [Corynebacterium macginleyi]MBK4151888.1 hypothetical protein [Corynebacterium macginleyi]